MYNNPPSPPNKSRNTHPCPYQSETATDQVQISYASCISMHSTECGFLPGTEMCAFKSCSLCSIKHSNVTQLTCTVWHSSNHHIKTSAVRNMRWITCQLLVKQAMSVFTDKASNPAFKKHACAPTLPPCLPRLTELLANILSATVVALYSGSNRVLALHLLGYRKVHHADNSDVDDNEIKRTHHDLWSHIYSKQSYIRTSDNWHLGDGWWVCSVTNICTFHLYILDWVTSNIGKPRYKIWNLL